MINIKELRIGNLVSSSLKITNIVYKVSGLDLKDSFNGLDGVITIVKNEGISNPVTVWCQCLEPIPLTPELLEKCGFEYDNGRECWGMDRECIDINISPKEIGIEVDCWENSLIKCNYLHQLQNMHYAITGKELEVKL